MKIEKINDNQIRCTLTRSDLEDRNLKLSELAYGTEKAKSLFHDMMQQAAFEFGFEADDIPLMIEAIPSSSDSIVLIITKVEDPEELDTRFSKFAPSPSDHIDTSKKSSPDKLEGADEALQFLNKLKESASEIASKIQKEEEPVKQSSVRLFSFGALTAIIEAAGLLKPMYDGINTLYKDPSDDFFILALTQSGHSKNDFNKICNMLTEYGALEKSSPASLAYLEEHCETILSRNALQKLADLY
nr:adaptor protein MecA [uncultured Sellimonas sp.]